VLELLSVLLCSRDAQIRHPASDALAHLPSYAAKSSPLQSQSGAGPLKQSHALRIGKSHETVVSSPGRTALEGRAGYVTTIATGKSSVLGDL
jgi:hypothetical protein